MTAVRDVEIVEIDDVLLPAVCRFLECSIRRGLSAADFSAALTRRWTAGPIGFALTSGGAVVGALGTVRAIRRLHAGPREFCNLTSFAVDTAFRSMAPALLLRAVRQPGVVYTNFTASMTVAALLRSLGFSPLPPREYVLLPWLRRRATAPPMAVGADAVAQLVGNLPDIARLVGDHRSGAVQWVGFEADEGPCAVALHLMRARGVPLAHVLYASAPDRFVAWAPAVARAVQRAWGRHLLAWPEWQIARASGSVRVKRPRPVMVKGDEISAGEIDGLYSELALLPIDA